MITTGNSKPEIRSQTPEIMMRSRYSHPRTHNTSVHTPKPVDISGKSDESQEKSTNISVKSAKPNDGIFE